MAVYLSFLASSFLTIVLVAQATVPASNTFKFVNEGDLAHDIAEYGDYRVSNIINLPFTVCFYNTTPTAFTLGIQMGFGPSESVTRWVWDANRGNPVSEGAALTFGKNGNLVLTDVDGRIAWQTGTANKGVVGLSLLSNGNLVLYDKKNKFVWQSFDYPTDTLLVGQSLRHGGPTTLTSRVSDTDGSNGPYSMVLEKNTLALYLKSKNSPKPIPYYKYDYFWPQGSTVASVHFESQSVYNTPTSAYEIIYNFRINDTYSEGRLLSEPKYNSTLSMLRVGSDGSLTVYTYSDKVPWDAWEVTYSLFDKYNTNSVSECKLPTRCGSLGVCEDSQCVACPKPQGLLAWSKSCAPPELPSCKGGVSVNPKYYKVVGVEHFMNDYNQGAGPMKVSECSAMCNRDCGCLGFIYKEETSKCLLAPVLGTLTRVSNPSHVAYIKTK